MLIMIDDVQLKDQSVFFPFISMALKNNSDSISDIDTLYDVVSEYDKELEVIIHDYDDVGEESMAFAKKVVSTFMDSRVSNKNLTVKFQQD